MKILPALLLLACAIGYAAPNASDSGPRLGLQTWTCRNMTFEQVVHFAAEHGIRSLELIGSHLSPQAPREETLRKKALLEQQGLVAYSFGVNGASRDGAANRRLFEFAHLMGIRLIIVEPPSDSVVWDSLEALVKEYDIRLAIHNHGRESTYGNPAIVQEILAHRDSRIGVCLDVGWITAAGFDAAKIFRDYHGRVFDIHFKDKRPVVQGEKVTWEDTMIGQGRADYTALFAELKRAGWSGVMAIETDSADFAAAPDTFVSGAAQFFRTQVATAQPH